MFDLIREKIYLYCFIFGIVVGAILFDKIGVIKISFYFISILFLIFIITYLVFGFLRNTRTESDYINARMENINPRFINIKSANKIIKNIKFILVALFIILISCTITIWRGQTYFQESKITKYSGEKLELHGIISAEPDKRQNNTRLIIKINKIISLDTNFALNTDEKIIATVAHYPEYFVGDKIKITGKIDLPKNFENDKGIEFNYVNFLKKDKIYSLTYYPKIELIEKSNSKNPITFIFQIKKIFINKMGEIFPSPQSELLAGILLGTKQSLGKELEDKFRQVGLIHIIVLSGYNVTIIAESILKFFGFLPRKVGAILGTISIFIFMIMVGSGATVVRSTIMTTLAIIARQNFRTYDVNRALFIAGGLMVIHNPMILLYDPSFQLSFLATIGLVHGSEKLQKIFKFLPEKFSLREITSATLSTQIAVLPLLMKMTGELSVVAPIVNIITLQFIPATMLFGFLAVIFGFVNNFLGILMAMIPNVLLSYILFIVELFSKFKFATISLI